MLRKMLIIATGLVVALAAPAAAQYGGAAISPSTTTVGSGGSLTVTGEGFTPGSTVDLTLSSASTKSVRAASGLGSAIATSAGTFSKVVTIPPSTAPGTYSIVASDGVHTATTTIVVTSGGSTSGGSSGGSGTSSSSGGSGSSGVSSGTLPRTGSTDLIPLTAAGAVLVAIGGMVVLAVRRRPATSA